ncbi:IucA/IucC family siderophore biosynthesis protein [Bdellovibrio sp. ZAP7]|uniref:IucA/IucC family protein n=1 Tax=Bdellovibrio sp. ZAP7 TaxID=2231053 RepID=UPI00115A2D80|nr:IucA/IucC family protein [Bdellovibrio sp. ZAP7]QDK46034.1 IucA/IucC family siderophore biosynthesis protein [Bdellovibrio sp. ZAP7]
MNLHELSLRHSASCFFNSLFREWFDYSIIEAPAAISVKTGCKQALVVNLKDGAAMYLPLTRSSLMGRHQYHSLFFIQKDSVLIEADFLTVASELAKHLTTIFPNSLGNDAVFLERLKNSMENIELALGHRQEDLQSIYSEPMNFQQAEQGLMIGHNFHPYPKMREGFDEADYRQYSPEMAGSFALNWFLAKPEVVANEKADKFHVEQWTLDAFLNDFENSEQASAKLKAGFIPFPVHPWQKQHLVKNPVVQSYLQKGDLIDLGQADKKWYPTTSLRSIYGAHSPYMMKFSLTLRLTNSIRHLTPVEVVRGLQVYDVFMTSKAQEFSRKHPQFHIVFEPAFMALKDAAGEILTESIVVCRENPFTENNNEEAVVLSTLAQDNPLGGENLIQKAIRKETEKTHRSLREISQQWFARYLEVAVKPLVHAQANYGILLGAHQQNLILSLKANFPEKAYFRDCQGTGYSHFGFSLYGKDVSSLKMENGNILDDKGNILFAYYLMINSTFNVIAAIAADGWVSEDELVMDLRNFLLAIRASNPQDLSCLNYLLDQAEIWHKGNFTCSLQNLNENTTANPLAIYNLIKNPIAAAITAEA